MGQAVNMIDNANARKRSDKALRTQGYTGNLVAFNRRPVAKQDTQSRTAMARFNAMQPTAEMDSQALNSTFSEQNPVPAPGKTAAHSASPGKSRSSSRSSPSRSRRRRKKLFPQKNLVTVAVVSALAVGAILGGVWGLSKSPAPDAEAEPAGPIVRNDPAVSRSANNVNAAVVPVEPVASDNELDFSPEQTPTEVAAIATPPTRNPATAIAPTANATAQLAQRANTINELNVRVAGYQEEIEWLNDQNVTLTEKVETLTNETLELNRELLGLELELAGTEPVTETRTVYNFVNVPIGGESAASAPAPSYVDNSQNYSAPVIYEEYASYPEDDQYMEQNNYYEDQEYREVYGYPEGGEPVYDPETGLYLSPEMLGGGGQQFDNGQQYIEQGTQVIYPPIAPATY